MKSFKKILAVTLVTAIAFVVLCVPAFAADPSIKAPFYTYYVEGVLNPSPFYPDSSLLPYGDDTLVFDLIQKANNGLVVHRVYVKNVVGVGSFNNIVNGTSVMLSYSPTYYFHLLVTSPNYPIYYEQMYYLDSDEWTTCYSSGIQQRSYYVTVDGVKVYSSNLYGTMSPEDYTDIGAITYPLYYKHCSSNSYCFLFNGNPIDGNNINNIPQELWDTLQFEDIVIVKPTLRSYPTSAQRDELMNEELKGAIEDGFSSVVENDNANTEKLQGSIKSAAEEISVNVGYNISNMRDSLLNAGGDIEGIDTDTSWMDDSVTKINEWLSELQDFEKQLSQNEVENSENMQQASYFLNGFFDNIPTVITAVCGLCLVMIVVVKVVGR